MSPEAMPEPAVETGEKMRIVWRIAGLALLLALCASAQARDAQRTLDQGIRRFQRGLYRSALRKFEKAAALFEKEEEEGEAALEAEKRLFESQWWELRTLRVTGALDACIDKVGAMLETLEAGAPARKLRTFRAGVLLLSGRPEEALKDVDEVLEVEEDHLRARLVRGYALQSLGKKEEAFQAFDWFVEHWAAHDGAVDAELLETTARAAIELGVQDQDLYLDAQRLLERCENEFPENLSARVALARLYMDRYARNQAAAPLKKIFKENPNYPPARATMAAYFLASYNNKKAEEECERALAVNPNLVEALQAKARVRIADQLYEEAEAPLKKALAVNPRRVDVMSLLAACRFMQGDEEGFAAYETKVLSLRPGYGEFYVVTGQLVSGRRRLEEAVAFFRKAIEVDPRLWAGYFALGINLSRQGKYEKAKAFLEKGFAGDRYNIQAANLLTLFDGYEHFVPHETEHFKMLFHRSEFTVMSKYCGRILEEGWRKLTKKYRFKPSTPVRVEMFTQHDDFAVRTLGFPGLGALGACFGPLITLDSPNARPPGAFNWACTTWHEFAHVVTVQLSKGRVPRWFTEGLSVYEERNGRTYWVRNYHRILLGRLQAGGLTPLTRLNAEFTRGDVLLAYFHASFVVEFIIDTFGFDAIRKMLLAYGEDLDDEGVTQKVFSLSLEALDGQFKAWLRERFADVHVSALYTDRERKKLLLEAEKHPRNAEVLARYARACLQNGRLADAEINAGKARRLDPDLGEASCILGEILYLKKRFEASETYFHEALSKGVQDYNAWLRLADMALSRGEEEKALRFYEDAREAYPQYVGPGNAYQKLRVLYGKRGREDASLEALETLVSMLEHNLVLRLELAAIYRRQGAKEKEIEILRQIHEIWPFRLPKENYPGEPVNTHLRLGRLLADQGDWEEARFEAETALEEGLMGRLPLEKPDEIEIRVFLAETQVETGEEEEARAQLEEVLEFLDPGNEKARSLLKKLESRPK